MTTAKERRELLRLAAHAREHGKDGYFTWMNSGLQDALNQFDDSYDGETCSSGTECKHLGPYFRNGLASILESLAYEEPPRNGYIDEPGPFTLVAEKAFGGKSADYMAGFRDGVASLNTERAEARAQIEALTARLRATSKRKKG
jgi:hypothetical protein